MKSTCLLMACLACVVVLRANAEVSYPDVIKVGNTAFWGEGTPMEKYGDGQPLMDWPKTFYEVRMWKIGVGVLVMEHTTGLCRIEKMSYVIRDKDGKIITSLPVKEFNHVSGEMTIIVTNQSLKQTGSADGTVEHC